MHPPVEWEERGETNGHERLEGGGQHTKTPLQTTLPSHSTLQTNPEKVHS